jgi:alpha-tubulin suppressor-like RCC1 family protein
VAGIAASRHTLLVTRNGSVWSFGPNDSSGGGGHGSKALAASGQLGRGGWWAPAQVAGALQGLTFKQVAAGRYHSVAVTADGRVYTWGLNDFGQLGRAATAAPAAVADAPASQEGAAQQGAHLSKDERLPRRNRQLQAEVVQPGAAAQAAAGAASQPAGSGTPSSVADAQGSSASPSCHSGWSCHDSAPGLVQALANVTVVAAKAGRYSTVVLDAEGQLWLWGYDGCCSGQLPQQDEAWEPRQVQGQLQGQRVVAFDVGECLACVFTRQRPLRPCGCAC